MSLKWVVFDWSGVVFTEGFKTACRAMAKEFGLDEFEVQEALLGEPAKGYRLGKQDPEAFWNAFGERFHVEDTRKARRMFFDSYEVVAEALEFIGRLRKRVKVAFFSFSPPDRAKYHEEKYHVSAHFDKGFFTWDVDAQKSEPVAFTRLCVLLGAKPEDVLFIDDKESYVQAARLAGLHAVVFTTFDALAKHLESFALSP